MNDTLYEMAESLLGTTEQALLKRRLTIPARKVIYMGTIPADCEQLAVVFSTWTPTPPIEGLTVCLNYRWLGAFTVLITRGCVPMVSKSGSPPSAASMSDAALVASNDANALLDVVASIGEHGGDVSVSTGAPQGGLQSTVLQIDLPIGGV